MSRNKWASFACGAVLLSAAPGAWAQDPEGTTAPAAGADSAAGAEGSASGSWSTSGATDGNANAQAAAPEPTPTATTTTTTTYSATTTTDAAPAPGGSDHAQVVGKFGVGYMGYRTITIAADPMTGTTSTVEAPVIGLRYWMDEGMGIDVGLGLSIATASTTAETPGMSTDTDLPQPWAFVVHGGLPLALHSSRHFSFQIVPELNIGYATNTTEAEPDDISVSGLHVDLGARAGAEIQFGFMDIPELSLQAGIGVGLSFDSQTAEQGDNSFSQSRTTFGTLTGENPWQIFQANVAALYYFGG